ncbi:methyltransferase domain-containing protein [Paenibacillus sp. LMG 31460]|uniref:Methyltransferase domain-containing protein n=1 Tax=Paenibacillus germinis TaxID=2654979 RepID=A0ABX1ZFC0_9BACL|nr:class I SAM-dependent methyltransferase [Paenibacillus germinis]NOU90605.1 methyltransferase domain-containing protein [Paenibacillus germinis]
MNNSTNVIKDNWNQWSETWYQKYRTDEVITKIITSPKSAFHHMTYSIIQEAIPDLNGKRVLVPSSGDNHAVFAFHLMGAKVTSCDISEKQLENGYAIAKKHDWDIEFICDDTMKLTKINSKEYDFVYTSNGVHVWINDLKSMYNNIQRVLKQDGTYIMFDIHPFMRPFGIASRETIKVEKPYDLIGPFGEVPTFKWRMQDIMNAIISSNFNVRRIEEMYAEDGSFWVDDSTDEGERLSEQDLENYCNWHKNPLAAIPQWLSIKAIKV